MTTAPPFSLGLVLALAGCSPEPTVIALELSGDTSCTPARLGALASVSVEVYGDADGAPCTLARLGTAGGVVGATGRRTDSPPGRPA